MHNEDYIASGILELYAAGGLSPAEQEEVERRAAASPEIRLALEEACNVMEAYAGLYAVRPRPDLKEKVLQRIGHQATAPEMVADPNPVRPLYPADRQDTSVFKWMLAASVALLLLSGYLSFYFYNQWQGAEERLAGVIASEQRLAQNLQRASLRFEAQNQLLAVLRDPAFKPVRLQSVAANVPASLTVYWNPRQQRVYVDEVALPAPPAGKQYQLWALHNDQPIDAGLIEVAPDQAGLQQMKNIAAAQAFAVTLEPAGGSLTPTLEQLTVMGKIES